MHFPIRLLNFAIIFLSPKKIKQWSFSKDAMVLNSLISILVCLADFSKTDGSQNILPRLMTWFMTFWMLSLAYFAAFFIMRQVQKRYLDLVVFTPIVHFCIAICSAVFIEKLQQHAGVSAGLLANSYVTDVILVFAILMFLEIWYILFGMNEVAEFSTISVPTPSTKSVTPKATHVTLGGTKFKVNDIIYIKSDDHYCVVKQRNGANYCRARLADAANEIDEDVGLIVHRSYWVALAGIKSVDLSTIASSVTMIDDTVIPIAKGRRMVVRHALSQQKQN